MAQRPVTLTDIVRGHVSLEIDGFDPGLRPKYFPCSRSCDEPGDGGEQAFVVFGFADDGGDVAETELAA
jgi:hypothetical protein